MGRATRFELVLSVWKTVVLAVKHQTRINSEDDAYQQSILSSLNRFNTISGIFTIKPVWLSFATHSDLISHPDGVVYTMVFN